MTDLTVTERRAHFQAAAWERRYEGYAGKFLAEHDDPEMAAS